MSNPAKEEYDFLGAACEIEGYKMLEDVKIHLEYKPSTRSYNMYIGGEGNYYKVSATKEFI